MKKKISAHGGMGRVLQRLKTEAEFKHKKCPNRFPECPDKADPNHRECKICPFLKKKGVRRW